MAIVLGLTIGDLYDNPDADTLQIRGIHMLTGTASALAVVFVHSIAVTYFVGTSRWCKEVTETYKLKPDAMIRSTQLKRGTFPWCVLGMLTVVGVGALGAASDPGTGRANTAWWADIHFLAAFLGLTFVAWTYYRAWLNITENQSAIQDIVEQVAKIRQERGLDTETEPQETSSLALN